MSEPKHSAGRRRAGFSLVELMIAVAIIGILAGVAQATFRKQVMRTKRTEAIVGLQGIYLAQQGFRVSQGHYGDTFDEIGFVLHGGRRIDARTLEGPVYTFSVQAVATDDDPRGNFRALATGDLDPGDGVLDILMIENDIRTVP